MMVSNIEDLRDFCKGFRHFISYLQLYGADPQFAEFKS
ncbi:hypothetical protein rpr22_0339 [Rickettsia prowazekii str. Rp22]|uniref:Uncharacterized protein n=1 Tax=Rickettsia prowazekii (strain Rp22) TaxID=449216 RepID=D5AWQ1_RICPP|nr:hypothetical protein rpr22_0339 [Rickettsia prowazekii str. Rp22]AGJ02040.1 hypothetical protein H374_7550 [Rickettsia prowazekii str. NMRC Madrid E]AGJ02515.1 hypothetical protein H375_2890 [Rickettsia prowazekii str. Breinl]EOB09684.1 hypothetical protein H376_6290 [Rickettsia prowazekii str. GvF12]EOB10440.1 Protein CyaY [Rickettsia prowazekii str. Cairo 3]